MHPNLKKGGNAILPRLFGCELKATAGRPLEPGRALGRVCHGV